jgi:transcription elongation factor Elf1
MARVQVIRQGDNPTAPRCPVCGALNDAWTAMKKKPQAGDASICLYCAALCVFNADDSLRIPTEEETVNMLADPFVIKLLETVVSVGVRRPE